MFLCNCVPKRIIWNFRSMSMKLQLPMKFYSQMLWVNPRQQLNYTQPFAHFTPQWDGERIRWEKLKMCWDKDIFTCKLDGTCENKDINSLLPISRQIFSPFQESKVSHAMATWKDKCVTQNIHLSSWFTPFFIDKQNIIWYRISPWLAVPVVFSTNFLCSLRVIAGGAMTSTPWTVLYCK